MCLENYLNNIEQLSCWCTKFSIVSHEIHKFWNGCCWWYMVDITPQHACDSAKYLKNALTLEELVMWGTNCLSKNQKWLAKKKHKTISSLDIIIIWCNIRIYFDAHKKFKLQKNIYNSHSSMISVSIFFVFVCFFPRFFFCAEKNFERICLLDFIPLLIQIKLNCQSFLHGFFFVLSSSC